VLSIYVVAEATTHKEKRIAAQDLTTWLLGRGIAAAERRNNFEGVCWERFGLGCAGTLRFKMIFAAAEQRFEFLLGADVGLGRISLIQTHGPSFRTPPLETTARKPCCGSLDLAARTVKNISQNCRKIRLRYGAAGDAVPATISPAGLAQWVRTL